MINRAGCRCWNLVALALLGCAALTSLSCSSSEVKPAGSLEAAEILELISQGQRRNDPLNDVEVELGKFRITHSVGDKDEVLLLVEARQGETGSAWHYGLARMTSYPAQASRAKKPVWSVSREKVPTDDPTGTFFFLQFKHDLAP